MVKTNRGYFANSWLFFLAALKFFRVNLDLIWIPIFSALVQLLLIFVFFGVFLLVIFSYGEVGAWWSENSSASLLVPLFLPPCP